MSTIPSAHLSHVCFLEARERDEGRPRLSSSRFRAIVRCDNFILFSMPRRIKISGSFRKDKGRWLYTSTKMKLYTYVDWFESFPYSFFLFRTFKNGINFPINENRINTIHSFIFIWFKWMKKMSLLRVLRIILEIPINGVLLYLEKSPKDSGNYD